MSTTKKTLKEWLAHEIITEGCEANAENFYEWFSEEDWVCDTDRDSHRWYTIVTKVHKIVIDLEERFFMWTDWETTGDGNKWDYGYEFDIEDVCEVYPKDIVTTTYVTKDKQ